MGFFKVVIPALGKVGRSPQHRRVAPLRAEIDNRNAFELLAEAEMRIEALRHELGRARERIESLEQNQLGRESGVVR